MADTVQYNLFARFRFMAAGGMGGMKTASAQFESLKRNANMARTGVRQVGSGLRTLSLMGAAAAVGLGVVIKRGAQFYQQMSVVRSVTKMTGEEFGKVRQMALQLGATTAFTSTQAAEGMENLARAGFTTNEMLGAITPTLKMASADSMDLATASDIVASSIRSFGLEADKATYVTDVLAYASKNSNTNIVALGESLKYAGAISKMAGQSFHTTVGILGLLANIGIKGSLAGTALKNAIMKLSKGSEAAVKLFGGKKGFKQALTDTTGKFRPMNEVIGKVIQRLKLVKNDADRAAIAFGIFGVRGMGAMSALRAAKPEHIAKLIGDIGTASKGTAAEMAKTRLDNVAGQWILFKSAVDNAAVSIFEVFRPAMMNAMPQAVSWMQQMGNAVRSVNEGMSEVTVAERYGKAISDVIFGIKEGATEAWMAFKEVGRVTLGVFAIITGGSTATRKDVVKLIAKVGAFIVIITPIAGMLAVIGMAGGAMLNIFIGGFKILTALTSRWGIALMAVTYAFSGGQREGETWIQTMARGMKGLISLADKLLWPFKMLAKHLGAIPALMAGIMAYKGAKFGLSRIGGRMAGRGGIAGAAGGMVGGGQPVFVTNWPIGMAMGGGAGIAGAAGAAGKMGLMARLGLGAKFAGAKGGGLLATIFGGKFLAGGTAGFAGVGAKTAAMAAGVGTATAAIGLFALALAPAVAGLTEMGRAYTTEGQRATEKKLLGGYRAQMKAERTQYASESEKRMALGMGPKQLTYEYLGQETHEYKRRRELIGQTGVNLGDTKRMREAFQALRGGGDMGTAVGKASGISSTALSELKQMSQTDLQSMGMTKEMLTVLMAISKATENQLYALEKGRITSLHIDGKQIAIATSQTRQESTERSGRPVEASARTRVARTGVR